MLQQKLANKNIILASKSPRRQELLKQLAVDFTIQTKEIEEVFPPALHREEIPLYLSELKANAFNDLEADDILITSDTIVWNKGQQLGKPKDRDEAIDMITNMSNGNHEVITAVTIKSNEKKVSFYEVTKVFFKPLTPEEIIFYVDNHKPYDKAGAYGIQEWIGSVAIEKIEGDYYTVVGFPLAKLYSELNKF